MDLLHLPAQLQQHRRRQRQRGALLRQDAVPVRLLDHHAGLHPAGALLPGRLLRLRLLLPAGPGRSRRRRLGAGVCVSGGEKSGLFTFGGNLIVLDRPTMMHFTRHGIIRQEFVVVCFDAINFSNFSQTTNVVINLLQNVEPN